MTAASASLRWGSDDPRSAFNGSEADRAFAAELVRLGPPDPSGPNRACPPPSPQVAAVLLSELGVEADDAEAVLESLPTRASSAWWTCVERTSRLIAKEMGTPHPLGRARPVFEGGADVSLARRCFLAHVFLAVVERTRDFHRALDVPEEVSKASFADLRRHMATHRALYGVAGVDGGWWATMSLRGALFDLGRLQFERARLGSSYSVRWEPDWSEAKGLGLLRGDACLGLHIPEGDRLAPEAVEASLCDASAFFPTYFPADLPPRSRIVGTCTSWLLDPQLLRYLREDSGIVAFQRRFTIVPGGIDDDRGIVRFVFRKVLSDPRVLPTRTTLERAVVDHLVSGGHWQSKTGWLVLP